MVTPGILPSRDTRTSMYIAGGTSPGMAGLRVQLGVLRLAWARPEMLDEYIELACKDYRDLLCAAEYPLSARDYRLKERDPEKYKKFQEEESARYDAWLEQVLSADISFTPDKT